jgi:hypothetical protein
MHLRRKSGIGYSSGEAPNRVEVPDQGWGTAMEHVKLEQLDRRTIAVEVSAPPLQTILKGVGRFERGGEFGTALRVGIADSSGSLEIILSEAEWDGQIDSGARHNCDYAVQLNANCLAPR